MKFTIVIPTYKGTDTLKIAIQSILNQKYKNFEIIVSDDNEINSDEQILTSCIISKLQENYSNIKYLMNDHHNGSYARNQGIKEAKGDYICLLDDDDYYLDNYLNEINNAIENNPGIELVFTDVIVISSEKNIKYITNKSICSKEIIFGKKEIGTGSNICFVNRKKSNQLFDERYFRHQDIEFVAKKLINCNYVWINECCIVKYYNKTDNYPNVNKALIAQELLRNDAYKFHIISEEEMNELSQVQLQSLFNDLVVKNASKSEICLLKRKMKEFKCYSIKNIIILLAHLVLKNRLNKIIRLYEKNRFDVCNSFIEYVIKEREKLSV